MRNRDKVEPLHFAVESVPFTASFVAQTNDFDSLVSVSDVKRKRGRPRSRDNSVSGASMAGVSRRKKKSAVLKMDDTATALHQMQQTPQSATALPCTSVPQGWSAQQPPLKHPQQQQQLLHQHPQQMMQPMPQQLQHLQQPQQLNPSMRHQQQLSVQVRIALPHFHPRTKSICREWHHPPLLIHKPMVPSNQQHLPLRFHRYIVLLAAYFMQ